MKDSIFTIPDVCCLFSYSLSTLKRREERRKISPRVKMYERRVKYQNDLIFKILEGIYEWWIYIISEESNTKIISP